MTTHVLLRQAVISRMWVDQSNLPCISIFKYLITHSLLWKILKSSRKRVSIRSLRCCVKFICFNYAAIRHDRANLINHWTSLHACKIDLLCRARDYVTKHFFIYKITISFSPNGILNFVNELMFSTHLAYFIVLCVKKNRCHALIHRGAQYLCSES